MTKQKRQVNTIEGQDYFPKFGIIKVSVWQK